MLHWSRRWSTAFILGCLASFAAGPARAAENSAPEFPSDPENWINSAPLTLGALKGKAAFLWFFEEGCPTCRAKWPSLLATAKKFEGKPVVFIGVNSGTSRLEVAQYAAEVGCNWPIIVDGTREFERQALQGQISLQNIYQARVIRADGGLEYGDSGDISATIDKALEGAQWKVDPADVPEALQPAWLNIEFGNYPASAAMVKKSLASRKPEVKQAAEKLKAAVQKEIDVELAQAKEALGKDDKWRAYRIYLTLGETYSGFDLPADVVATKKKLAVDPAIKKELAALENLKKAKRIMASGKPNSHKMLIVMLEKMVRDQGATTAGAEAADLLARLKKGENVGGESEGQ